MGPRKTNAFASGKDDGPAAGKVRKVGANGVPSSTATGNTNQKQGADITATRANISYTNEERSFLESQLTLFTSAGGGSCGTDFASMTKEQWMAGLSTLVSATEKLLQVAAEEYTKTCREHTAAVATANGALQSGFSSGVDGCGGGRHGTTPSSSDANGPAADGIALGEAAGSLDPRSSPAAGTPAQFAEENAYIIAQAQQLQWFPFTYQRWVELLLDPCKHHTAGSTGRLRGDAIQASLRRCILVTYPAVEGGDLI
ncbi:hypothetical protein JKF63_04631 [Porcisia hertigi]|uniref:Uncharacterized protein n=1 Tax=Porcisia hertigi TaxID=2761500 RepID=A0A836I1G0_9TRYP|nr:hypothetical protein JKF63_04631 [Porcisia hertigi]